MKYCPFAQTVLALETSCDESAAALLRIQSGRIELIANSVASQMKEHAQWGGVVPEIASRRHVEAMPYVLDQVLQSSSIKIRDLDAIAATVAPGLSGSLLIGSITARTLSSLYGIPFLGIHHLEGHLASVFLSNAPPIEPYLVLLVSGGHTELIKVQTKNKYFRLGRSHDDAAGEAFDKVARLLGLEYPGGPAIEKMAMDGDPKRFSLPKGKVSNPKGGFFPYDFSFSGLKTAMLRKVNALSETEKVLPLKDLAASFENVVAEVLVERTLRCATDHNLNTIVMVGGVASNKRLRTMISEASSEKGIQVHIAPLEFCTDNAAMIGAAALLRLSLEECKSSLELGVSARWPLEKADFLYRSPPPF